MGKASNRKKDRTILASSIAYGNVTVFGCKGVNPNYGQLVVKAIQSIYNDDLAQAKSDVGALEHHGVSIFDYQVGFAKTDLGLPHCACEWAFATDARETLSWLIQKAVFERSETAQNFFEKVLYQIEIVDPESVEFQMLEFAVTTYVEFCVVGRAEEALDSMPQGSGLRARAIVIDVAQKELVRVAHTELQACIPPRKRQASVGNSSKDGAGRL